MRPMLDVAAHALRQALEEFRHGDQGIDGFQHLVTYALVFLAGTLHALQQLRRAVAQGLALRS
jgi:hypothetical protein